MKKAAIPKPIRLKLFICRLREAQKKDATILFLPALILQYSFNASASKAKHQKKCAKALTLLPWMIFAGSGATSKASIYYRMCYSQNAPNLATHQKRF